MKAGLIFGLIFNLFAVVFNIMMFVAGVSTAIIWIPLNLLMAGWLWYLLHNYNNY